MNRSAGRQNGQSMVEYTVILAALTAALLAAGPGSVEELRQGVVDKQRGYSYAISLSEIPESGDLQEIAAYYKRLGKYPALQPQLAAGGQKLGQFVSQLEQADKLLSQFDPANAGKPLQHLPGWPPPLPGL